MNMHPLRSGKTFWHIGFGALLCASLGFLLLEACTVGFGGKPAAHLLNLVLAGAPALLIYRRARRYRLGALDAHETYGHRPGGRWCWRTLASGLVLAAGACIGADLLSGPWATVSGLCALGLYMLPWSRLPICRHGLVLPWLIVTLAAASTLLAKGPAAQPMMLLLSACVLLMSTVFAWMAMVFAELAARKRSGTRGARHADAWG